MTQQLRHASGLTRWRLVLVAAALFDTIALAGCAAEGTTRVLAGGYYGEFGPGRLVRHRGVDFDALKVIR